MTPLKVGNIRVGAGYQLDLSMVALTACRHIPEPDPLLVFPRKKAVITGEVLFAGYESFPGLGNLIAILWMNSINPNGWKFSKVLLGKAQQSSGLGIENTSIAVGGPDSYRRRE